MAEIRTPNGLVVGLIVADKPEKNEPKHEATPGATPEGAEKKRGGRPPKTEK